MTILRIEVGDVVRMKKPHPCGGLEWEVTRTGTDVAAVCLCCGRRVMMGRSRFEKAVKEFVSPQE